MPSTHHPAPPGQAVAAHQRSWTVPVDGYHPPDVTTDDVLTTGVQEGWAEPETDPTRLDFAERIARAVVPYTVVDGRPRNPAGRTGRRGRQLGLWGENAAADPIVVADVADNIEGPQRYVLLVRREDCAQWAIPAGMVEPGEDAQAALVRELWEETGVDLHDLVPHIVTRTYVDDPRNTDEAWVSSTVALFRVTFRPEPVAGSDALDARWFPFRSLDELAQAVRDTTGDELYEAHRPLLQAALDVVRADEPN